MASTLHGLITFGQKEAARNYLRDTRAIDLDKKFGYETVLEAAAKKGMVDVVISLLNRAIKAEQALGDPAARATCDTIRDVVVPLLMKAGDEPLDEFFQKSRRISILTPKLDSA